MPSTLEAAVLTVDVGLIHKVDTRNVENLFSMWSVFSRCASSLEEGRRLENLSWRLWNRETFCCDPVSDANATTPAISIASRISEGHYAPDVPELSSSFDSSSDEDVLEFDSENLSSSTLEPVSIPRPRVYRQDSLNSSRSRGRERHITPDDLEKMVITIKEKKELEPLPTHSYLPMEPATPEVPSISVMDTPVILEELTSDSGSDHSSQAPVTDSSCTSERSTTSIVKGFSPAHISNSYRSPHNMIPHLPSSIPTADIVAANAVSEGCVPKKKAPKFMLPSSGSDTGLSGHNNTVLTQQAQPAPPTKKKTVFHFGGSSRSSNEDELSLPTRVQAPSALTANLQKPAKKQTSFKEEVATRIIRDQQPFDDDVFETDEDDIDESAIDDEDDSSDWEDSNEESNTASIDEKTFFKRVDSRPNLTSRPSLITLALNKNAAVTTPGSRFNQGSRSTPILQRSRTTSPSGPSLATSPEEPLTMQGNLKSIAEIPIPQPIIMTTTNTHHHVALSPRTTRRNMLSTELTVSLRQHLLWERKQKSQTANAVLKRRHTAQDMANLKQFPDKVHMNRDEHESNASYNQYFSQGLGEYHSKGW